MIFIFFLVVLVWSALAGMSAHDLQIFAAIMMISYLVGRILANLFFEADAEIMHRANSRRNFGRGTFGLWVDKEGKMHIRTDGDERDHSQRCIDSLNESYDEERLARWNNWIYAGLILAIVIYCQYAL